MVSLLQKKYWWWTRLLSMILLLCFSLMAEAQSDKRDYVWLFGHDSRTPEGVESYRFDFNNGSSPDSIRGLLPIQFLGNNASICDKEGNLLYYTNGCHVVGRNHQILPNGSGLNDGDWITQFRGDTCSFYPTTQDILILPDPEDENNHYVIHKPIEIGEPFFKSFRYSFIDGNLNDNIGDVTIKAEPIIENIEFLSSYLNAVPHANNEDWWITQSDENANLYSILLDNTGFSNTQITKIQDDPFSDFISSSGKSQFSPDGTKYAFYNPYTNLSLFDFDRSTGEFSNQHDFIVEEFPQDVARFASVEWSPNSRFIYITNQDKLWQIDTWEENLEEGLELIDVWNGASDPFQTQFFLMALAPDCKIYMCSFSSTNTYHVINNPNGKGQDCDFVQQGIRLPFVSASATMPNFPRFRVDEEDKCDPTITSVFGDNIYWRRDLVTYPNPVSDILTIEMPESETGCLYVFDMQGQLIMSTESIYVSQAQLDMTGLPSGTYSVEFIPDDNPQRRLWTSRVVKVE